MPDYATKDDLKRFVQYLQSELRKADRPDLQWVLYGEGRVVNTLAYDENGQPCQRRAFTLQRERTIPRGIVRMTQ